MGNNERAMPTEDELKIAVFLLRISQIISLIGDLKFDINFIDDFRAYLLRTKRSNGFFTASFQIIADENLTLRQFCDMRTNEIIRTWTNSRAGCVEFECLIADLSVLKTYLRIR